MAKTFFPLDGSPTAGVVIFAGEVNVGSDGYVTSQNIQGVTCEYSGTAAGGYVFTVTNPLNRLLFSDLVVEKSGTAVDLVAQRVASSGSSVTFRLLAGATATTPSAVMKLSFFAVLANSNLGA